MSVPNRQIGWSNESNLLWNISKQLEKLNGVVAATAAGGMLNPTTNYIPFNSGLAFGDSYLVNDTTSSVLKTVYSGNDVGLVLDFVGEYYAFGDFNGVVNGSVISISDTSRTIGIQAGSNFNNTSLLLNDLLGVTKTQYGGVDIGLNFDFVNLSYALGTADGGDFATSIFGIKADVATYKVTVGDTWINNATNIIIDASANQVIYTQNAGYQIGLTLDFASKRYFIGDDSVVAYDAYLGVESSATRNAIIAGVQLTAASAGAASGQFLKVRIGGVDYKIALLNNA